VRHGAVAAAGISLGCALAQPAAADTLGPSTLVSESTLVENQESNVYSFSAPGPGTLSVQLSDLLWPNSLSALNFSLNSPTNVLGWVSSAGSLSLQVPAGTYYADVSGTAGGPLDLGLYSLQITFQPQGSEVALPASIGLLLGGLAILAGARLRWMRNESFMYGV
jgi:hypothetical protein